MLDKFELGPHGNEWERGEKIDEGKMNQNGKYQCWLIVVEIKIDAPDGGYIM